MITNVIDVDEAMLESALSRAEALAIFLDFETAFPRIDQTFIIEVLKNRGWPSWFLNFVIALYDNNCCNVALNGYSGDGFKITASVRQGCPLSRFCLL